MEDDFISRRGKQRLNGHSVWIHWEYNITLPEAQLIEIAHCDGAHGTT